MKKPARKQLWKVVKRLILEHPDEISKAEDIRDSFYIVGDLLSPLIGKEITKAFTG